MDKDALTTVLGKLIAAHVLVCEAMEMADLRAVSKDLYFDALNTREQLVDAIQETNRLKQGMV